MSVLRKRSATIAVAMRARLQGTARIRCIVQPNGVCTNIEIEHSLDKTFGQVDKKLKLLRRIPIDPMTGDAMWGKRSLQDDPNGDSWGHQNIFDVYSLSEGIGLDGSKYREW